MTEVQVRFRELRIACERFAVSLGCILEPLRRLQSDPEIVGQFGDLSPIW